MPRLTADLISSAETRINPLRDRELILRDLEIPKLENLAITRDQFTTIDLSNNSITALANVPKLNRLEVLILSNNKIQAISQYISEYIPNLRMLMLQNSDLKEIGDLEPLTKLTKLEHLVLQGSPVCKKEGYRGFLVNKLPAIRWIDFKRVTRKERLAAAALSAKVISSLTSTKSANTGHVDTVLGDARPVLSAEEQAKIKEQIKNAKSLDEILKLEKQLRGEL